MMDRSRKNQQRLLRFGRKFQFRFVAKRTGLPQIANTCEGGALLTASDAAGEATIAEPGPVRSLQISSSHFDKTNARPVIDRQQPSPIRAGRYFPTGQDSRSHAGAIMKRVSVETRLRSGIATMAIAAALGMTSSAARSESVDELKRDIARLQKQVERLELQEKRAALQEKLRQREAKDERREERHAAPATQPGGDIAAATREALGAYAADMPVKAAPIVPYFNWSGFYAGINAGYSVGRDRTTRNLCATAFCSADDFKMSPAGVIGGQLAMVAELGVRDRGRCPGLRPEGYGLHIHLPAARARIPDNRTESQLVRDAARPRGLCRKRLAVVRDRWRRRGGGPDQHLVGAFRRDNNGQQP
jgi:hypothetical protein